ncbi:ribosomal RNA large subunit methyltransferase J [Bifidobacterium margollesii]|uniref:Ribosomal RNA large subunit methyltransferase J n=1 Tax=Bifidobacterium margollesii TaxID=2020964 RepID=A0A2N5J8M6_9BIFI|nr:TlyA family RNA methyltransferase [Bifidobacterium margollesii]PLS30557.1 ribosomal RNA large subunit methyltransferase J [Bifidobacterium margollesii]
MSQRLDAELVERSLVQSRSRAQRLIRDGRVMVDGVVVMKPSASVTAASHIDVDLGEDYVSRGAYKLVGAFDVFGPQGLANPRGLRCLDIGASTGGFTEVLLRRGASQVVALDVGHGQLAPRIADDVRVTDMSGVNIRDIHVEDLPYRPEMIVSDVSFISLTYVIPVIARIIAPESPIILLVKPQFEVGRGHLGKNGIVEHEEARRSALTKVISCAEAQGFVVRGTADSPISGTHGNHEYLLWLQS